MQFLKDHSDEYAHFFAEDESLASYISQLAIPGSWGDNLSIMVCAELLQSPIHIAQPHGVQVISPAISVGDPIWVAYDGSTHYDSVCQFHAVFGATPIDFY